MHTFKLTAKILSDNRLANILAQTGKEFCQQKVIVTKTLADFCSK